MNEIETLKKEISACVNEKWELENKQKALEEKLKKEIAKTLLKPLWEFECAVKLHKFSPWEKEVEEGTEVIYVRKVIANLEEIEPLYKQYDIAIPDKRVHNSGIFWFRKNNVLLHFGGGTLHLRNYAICTDDEWEQIKQGNIPAHLLH